MKHRGLTTEQTNILLKKYGLNKLPEKGATPFVSLLVNQLKNMLSILLFIAAVLSFAIGDSLDGSLILLILLLNALLGFWQEFKVNKELDALRKLQSLSVRVIRDNQEIEIDATQIVPGDLIILEAGSKVPADCQVVEAKDLFVNEASLTGESMPVVKTTDQDDNQIYLGTEVVVGRCKAIVLKTGVNTKFGSIASTLSEIKPEKTVFEKSLDSIAQKILIAAILLSILLFVIRFNQGFNFNENFFTSLALMVAAVPEGLPAVITLTLALGVRRMYKQKALVRRLGSIQDLGAVSVICTDKTGTITRNEMRVLKTDHIGDVNNLVMTAILCNGAALVLKEDGQFDVLGDTTEGALLIWANQQGFNPETVRSGGKLLDEIPFSLDTRLMVTLWQINGKKTIHVKGAPEAVLPICKLDGKEQQKLVKNYQTLASLGLRVMAFASKQTAFQGSLKTHTKDLNFLGFVGIADEERPEARQAILEAKQAGIKVIMITGDNELTAKAIAERVGLLAADSEVITGIQLTQMSDDELQKRMLNISVFARVLPEHKLRIVKILQKMGEIVAVTGDGVNDSLALKQGQVGLAMGKLGTDVAKEASDIIILDDNFATIIKAIEQGRLIYGNITKILKFLMSGNLSEVLTVLGGVLLGLPTPLLAIQILWVNFVTDGLPALALAADLPSLKIMKNPPIENPNNILSSSSLKFILLSGFLMAALVLMIFAISLEFFGLQFARTAAFSSLVSVQMIFVFLLRSHHSIWSNKWLLGSVLVTITLQVLIVTIPELRAIFKLI